jgi:iron(III) transport system ATP-binding protein
MATGAASVTVQGLTKRFGEGAAAVNSLDLTIKAGDFFTLLGPSGCGKTTTLRMIAGLEYPDDGEVKVGDRTVSAPKRRIFVQPDKRRMGMVFQSYAVWPHMTVFENVAFPLQMQRRPRSETRQRTLSALDMVGLAKLADRPAPKLSGGQQQRVALARALVGNPQVLLLDEPLSNLDARLREEMRFEIRSMQQRLGITTIFVTHDQDEAMTLSDQIAVMNLGNIEQVGTPREVYEQPSSQDVMDFLGHVNHLPATVRVVDGRVMAVVAGQEIPVPQADGLVDGDDAVLAFRSECVHLTDSDAQLRGTVKAATYIGDHMSYLITIGDSAINASSPTTAPHAVGSPVGIRLEPTGVRAWRQTGPVPA